jgi:hypothetical protein
MSDRIDTNVQNYTLSELMAILSLDEPDPDLIVKRTDEYIEQYKKTDPQLSSFFLGVQNQLLNFASQFYDNNNDNIAEYPNAEKQINDWYQNENLTQNNSVQIDKITERKQKIELFGNQHVPMNRQQLGINNNYNVPVAQDTLNPNLKNTISRFVNLDSQFRQYSSGTESIPTDYTLDLSDTLYNVLSIRLYSYQIPYTWYTIDEQYGNTCLWITDGDENVVISVPSGNYTQSEFIVALNIAFSNAGFTFASPNLPASYNSNTGKLTLDLIGGTYSTFTITTNTIITFYDVTGRLQCNSSTNSYCVNKSFYLNQTLGWIMGFRVPFLNVNLNGNTGTSVLDLIGTKYLILVIDDYNQNHLNNGLVSITELSNNLKIPNYYTPDMPYVCAPPSNTLSNIQNLIDDANLQSILDNQGNTTDNGLLLAGKLEVNYVKTPIILPSAPRTLTQSQIYTINEINKNRNTNTNYRAKAPTSTDILAVIPVKASGSSVGTLLVEFSGSLQDNIRTYFGPVNIERMKVKLLDDKGNILNLNGADWCVTLICDCLYQY